MHINTKHILLFIVSVKRKTRRKFSDEEKIRIVVEWLLGEESIAEIARREGIAYIRCYTFIIF